MKVPLVLPVMLSLQSFRVRGFASQSRSGSLSDGLAKRRVLSLPRTQLMTATLEAPTGTKEKALSKEAAELDEAIENKHGGVVIAQVAPATRVGFPEIFGMAQGSFSPGILVASLKALGFDLVLDTNTAADLTICEEGSELLHRIMLRESSKNTEDKSEVFGDAMSASNTEPLPLFTSCCPGWMNFVQKSEPDLFPYISTCMSPNIMLGSVLKTYSRELLGHEPVDVYFTSVMPCVRKRSESDQAAFCPEGIRHVDNVITTRDLGELLQKKGINPASLDPVPFDSPFQVEGIDHDGLGSGAGQLFGATGGVMEAAVRSVYELLTGAQLPRLELEEVRGLDSGIKEALVPLYNEETGKGIKKDLHVAVVNGLGNAKKLLKKMRDKEVTYDFVEVMACPGGCVGGAGQPKAANGVVKDRLETIYKLDRTLPIRRSHENPTIQTLYKRHIGEIGGEEAHHLLHVKPVYGESDREE